MRRPRSSRLALGIAVALLLAACGGVGGPSAGSTQSVDGGGGNLSTLDFELPLPGSVQIERVEAASLAFSPHVPSPELAEPASIWATTQDHAATPFRAIAWVYHNDPAGTFVIVERATDGVTAMHEWKSLVAEIPGCTTISPLPTVGDGPGTECNLGTRTFVTIRGDVTAFILDQRWADIHWLEDLKDANEEALAKYPTEFENPALEIDIFGPQLSPDDAIRIANAF